MIFINLVLSNLIGQFKLGMVELYKLAEFINYFFLSILRNDGKFFSVS